MANDYGVYEDGTDFWVKTASPLILSSADQAALYSEADAMTVATYLTTTAGQGTFKVGRPDDRHPR